MKSYLIPLIIFFTSIGSFAQVTESSSGRVNLINTDFSFTLNDGQFNRPIVKTGWITGIGDYVYLKNGGNNTETNTYGLRISDGLGLDFGRNEFASSLFKIGTNGNVGIGTITPSARLQVASQTGQTERLARFQVLDATDDFLDVSNITGTPGQFIPSIKGQHVSDNRPSLYLQGQTSDINDTGNHSLLVFDARRPSGPIQTRPLFAWTSYTTKMMTMLANGNLGIGTTSPGSKLDVNGTLRAQDFITVNTNGSYKVALNGQSDGYIAGRDKFICNKIYN